MKLWIARDMDGALTLFEDKPYKNQIMPGLFESYSNEYLIDSELFPEITFENSPQQVELKLIEGK